MTKQNADEFIREHRDSYGLKGTNTPHNPARFPQRRRVNDTIPTRDNHFVCGYNYHPFVSRRSSTCIYFTDYGAAKYTGTVLPLDTTLINTAKELEDQYGTFTVVNRGRYEDHAFLHACHEADANFSEVAIYYDGKPEGGLGVSWMGTVGTLSIRAADLLDVAKDVVPWLRTKSLFVIQDILIASTARENLVFPSRLKFTNHNHDSGRPCGPRYWALRDEEEDTALMRFGWHAANGANIRVPNLAVWSTDLIQSQLCDTILKQCLTGNDNQNADHATELMWKSACPAHILQMDLPDWWDSVQEEVTQLHDNGKHNEVWYTPLHRLLTRYGINYPREWTEETYGTIL